MQTIHLTHTDPKAEPAIRLMRAAFPGYAGRTFKIRVASGPIDVRSSWEGGSRDYFRFVSLADGRTSAEMPAQSAFDRPVAGADAVTLPDGAGCVQHTIFCGKDLGLTLIIPASNAPALLPPAADDLSDIHAYCLIATASLKNTYGGETEVRYKAVRRLLQCSREDWDKAVHELQARKLLNGQRAITPDGRNAVAQHPMRNRIN